MGTQVVFLPFQFKVLGSYLATQVESFCLVAIEVNDVNNFCSNITK